jgi:succinoglycan biosynthesis transport protein ExoP
MRTVPVYRSLITIRIKDATNEMQSVVREALLPLTSGSEVSTEREVLGSRTLIEDAVKGLGLQLRLVEPTRIARSQLLRDIRIDTNAPSGAYVLNRDKKGKYVVAREDEPEVIARVAPDERVEFRGIAFHLRPQAAEHDRIRLLVATFPSAVEAVNGRIKVTRLDREAKILTLDYESSDPELTSAVPNLIAERFVARRVAGQRAAVGSTIAFLRQQLDTLADQLRAAEAALLAYRERQRVVNPTVEGSSQVNRIVQLQSERSTLETERAALAKLMSEVERAAASKKPEDPSPYRNLMSFPTLLRNETATRLLDVLISVEGERTDLLARRTPTDPDVQTLTDRMKSIETALHAMAATYLQGLTHQVSGIDTTLSGFGRELQQVPQRELRYARLVRQPKLLEDLFSFLQTRLKEAEIAQAANDLSVQVVDPAIRPRAPVRPRPVFNLFVAMVMGGLIGVGAGFLRDIMDKSVHTRTDILLATGLSVIGLIPRIPQGRSRYALISEKRPVRHSLVPPAVQPPTESSDSAEPAAVLRPRKSTMREVAQAAAAEAYASLLTNLSYSLPTPPKVVVFTSGQPGEGKTTNAVNFALAATHRGSKVLLVDCDMRRGLVHSIFEVPREPGLTNVLWGQMNFEQARGRIAVGEHATIDYLTTGTLPPNPSSLVESDAMRNLLECWREEYDGVIIDTPPVNVITDAALLGAHADGVVLVARAGVTHAAALGYALEQLRRVRAQVLGVLLSDIDFAREATYDPTYKYHRYEQYTTAGT